MADQFDDIIKRMSIDRAAESLVVDGPGPDVAARANSVARETGDGLR